MTDETTPSSKWNYLDYLATQDKTSRLRILAAMIASLSQRGPDHPMEAGQRYIPIAVTSDLLLLDLGLDEKLRILEATSSRDPLALEDFLTSHLVTWPQELAALALRLWSARTHHLLWFRLAEAIRSSLLPQRVLYTALDVAEHGGGRRLVELASESEGLATMSQALHGLILHRAVQWSVQSERLRELALNILTESSTSLHPDNKALASALGYLARYSEEDLVRTLAASSKADPWHDLMHGILTDLRTSGQQIAHILTYRDQETSAAVRESLAAAWLPLWARHRVTPEALAVALKHLPSTIGYFGGIAETLLAQALEHIKDTDTFARMVGGIHGLFQVPTTSTVLDAIKVHLSRCPNPAALLQSIPLRLRLELTEREPGRKGTIPQLTALRREESQTMSGTGYTNRESFTDEDETMSHLAIALEGDPRTSQVITEGPDLKRFFAVAYRGQSLNLRESKDQATTSESLWTTMAKAWVHPTEDKLGRLASAARQEKGILRLCYIDTLGRFKGLDAAALKLLDFIRSSEEDDLRAVIRALGQIGTVRAAQELVSSLTRPNMTQALQLEACMALSKLSLEPLQQELRSTLNDLSSKSVNEPLSLEIREAVIALLTPTQTSDDPPPTSSLILGDRELDQTLSGMIPGYKDLSSEVRRALRTSLFFQRQVNLEAAPDSIDLSPVIDMQYKALELLFRETFEEACSRVIQKGLLQRRLDIIGYARPVPHAMDDFESYVASLPIVCEIPFFSKFKLRKTLRAICQFRPGKRFTLDGLKAFALFFLCFSRKECRFGLADHFPLGLGSDTELFEFCKALHIFQDFRNRAAHEGFHPEAAQDMMQIWRQTTEIVQGLQKAKQKLPPLKDGTGPGGRPGPVIITKKVS